jgi:hypothetical protein
MRRERRENTRSIRRLQAGMSVSGTLKN